MNNKKWKRCSTIFLFFSILPLINLQTDFSYPSQMETGAIDLSYPSWMQTGANVEYNFTISAITFNNKTSRPLDPEVFAIWRWTCDKVEGDIATLNVSLRVEEENSFSISNQVYVNITTREVFLANGTSVGATFLWAPANAEKDEEITLWKKDNEEITGTVQIGGVSATPQGYQQIYILRASSGTMMNRKLMVTGYYDLDTGILTDGYINNEITLFLLGIKHLGIMGCITFSRTNIDLGPKEILPEILPPLVTIIIIAVVVVLTWFVYRTLTKRKKRKR